MALLFKLKNKTLKQNGILNMKMHTCNPNHWEVKAGELVQDQGQPSLHSKFQTSQDSVARPCLKIQNPGIDLHVRANTIKPAEQKKSNS